MKVSFVNKKEGVYSGQNDIVALLKLMPEDLQIDKSKKVKKNVCFVIDRSSSMGSPIKNVVTDFRKMIFGNSNQIKPDPVPAQPYVDPYVLPTNGLPANLNIGSPNLRVPQEKDQLNNLRNYINREVHVMTRFQLVIEATKQAISKMNSDDFASVVLFGSDCSVLSSAMQMTEQNKLLVIQRLNTAMVNGLTNLHGGWMMGVEEVAKNLSDEYINRVILLTDGAVNQGETDPDRIATAVADVNKLSVSTTTIGVGEGFNEFLLQGMASAGSGNSYFIDSNESVTKTFDMEFTGLSNISATDIRVSVKTASGIELVKNMNLFPVEDDKFKFPSLSAQDINAVFVFKLSDKKIKGIPGVVFKISYKDTKGNKHNIKIESTFDIKSKEVVDGLEANQEVMIQELLNTIAEQKVQAQRSYSQGDTVSASNMLVGSLAAATSSLDSFAGNAEYASILRTEMNNLEVLSRGVNVAGDETFSKTLSYQAYRTRNAQDKQ